MSALSTNLSQLRKSQKTPLSKTNKKKIKREIHQRKKYQFLKISWGMFYLSKEGRGMKRFPLKRYLENNC